METYSFLIKKILLVSEEVSSSGVSLWDQQESHPELSGQSSLIDLSNWEAESQTDGPIQRYQLARQKCSFHILGTMNIVAIADKDIHSLGPIAYMSIYYGLTNWTSNKCSSCHFNQKPTR